LADCHHALEEAWWIYLVRSLGFQPEPSSHDWHVQPSCQRTDPLPPERALSVQSRLACVAAGDSPAIFSANLPVLETCTNYASCALTVNPRWHRIFTCFPQLGELYGLLFDNAHWAMPMWDRVSDPVRSSNARRFRSLTAHAAKRFFLPAGSTARLCHFGTSRGGRASV
jgi:hypothetical protein